MDPNVLVLEISSDEDVGWVGHDDKEIIDGGDHNWIAELLDEVNRDDSGYDDGPDDSDEVMIVKEVLPSKKIRRKLISKCSSLIGSDDDCMVLDHDPSKPPDVRNDDPTNRHEDDDSDDLLVVSETGQVACRDYPHPRHLCIKFPFSSTGSTPNKSYCEQCYCYVCDSLAPCLYWGNGSDSIHHCHANDKDEFWKLERKNSKKGSKIANPCFFEQRPTMTLGPPRFQTPSMHNQVPQPIPAYGRNFINQHRSPFLSSRNKHQPGLIRTSTKVHHSFNPATTSHKPVFKRIGSAGIAPTTNRYSYNYKQQNNRVNEMVSGSSGPGPFLPAGNLDEPCFISMNPTSLPSESQGASYSSAPEPFYPTGTLDEPRFMSMNPTSLPSQSQGASYSIPCESGNQDQRSSTIDQNFFHDINWPQSAGPTNELIPAGLVDYQYDDWLFNNQAYAAGSMEELCPEPGFKGYDV